MALWDILSWASWIVSVLLFAWMIFDAFSVSQKYSEDFLMSSREGEE
jgi:hypothetical protein